MSHLAQALPIDINLSPEELEGRLDAPPESAEEYLLRVRYGETSTFLASQ